MSIHLIDNLDSPAKSVSSKEFGIIKGYSIKEETSLQERVLNIVLGIALDKYKKHVEMIRPALDNLLCHVELNPKIGRLKELLAVKKSLTHIQMNIQTVENCVKIFAEKFCEISISTNSDCMFKYFYHNVDDINLEMKMMMETIEDTDQYVSIHLDTVR